MLWFGSIVLTIHCCLSLSIFLELDARCCWVRQGVWAILSRFPLGFFRKWVGCRRHHAPGCGPVWQGRREHPQRRFSLHTHLGVAELRGASQGTLSRTCRHTFPGSLWLQPLCPGPHWDQWPSAVRQVERPRTGSVVSTRENAVPLFSWLFDSLLSLILGGGGKEDAIYNSTKAIYFEPWRCWLHIYSFKIIFDTFSA